MKSDEANYFNLQLDSMINEKSRNILSNLDKKLEGFTFFFLISFLLEIVDEIFRIEKFQ